MHILSIETSCDETAVSILKCEGGVDSALFKVLGNALYSQAKDHEEFGGVYPNVAKREHAKNLVPLLEKALDEADLQNTDNQISDDRWEKAEEILERHKELYNKLYNLLYNSSIPHIDAVSVTSGPGLEPALWVGLNLAKGLSVLWNKPLVPVNHLEAHMMTPLIERSSLPFPLVSLTISGGHTQLVYGENLFDYKMIGETQDDAIGEAFDKEARMLGLGYPGGPQIARLASKSRDDTQGTIHDTKIELPRPMIKSGNYDFSFSGLKTAVMYLVEDIKEENDGKIPENIKKEIAREFEEAVTDVLVSKTKKALSEFAPSGLVLGGGVVANTYIRKHFERLTETHADIELLLPPRDLATDNAVMIGVAGYLRYKNGDVLEKEKDIQNLSADGRLRL